MNMELKDRIKKRIEELEWSQEKLADEVGVTQPAIQWLLVGKTKQPRYIKKLAEVLGVSYEWLLTGVEPQIGTPYNMSQPKSPRKIPIIGWVHAGNPMEAIEHVDPDYYVEADFEGKPNTMALKIQGNSMNVIAPEDSIILFNPDEKFTINGKYYIIRVNNDEAVFRQFVMQGDTPLFVPCSTEEGHKIINPEKDPNVEIIGRVFHVVGKDL